MTPLHTATADGHEYQSHLDDGVLYLTEDADGSNAIRLTLAEADAVATFLRVSIDRALLHGARKESL